MERRLDGADGTVLPVLSADPAESLVDQVVQMAKALSDPIRVRMLGLMAEGRSCCGFAVSDAVADSEGICVCEFQDLYGLGQSKVSYHLRILKDAGLVTETARGKWTYYALNRAVARDLIKSVQKQLKL